jgi:hypothetical protein
MFKKLFEFLTRRRKADNQAVSVTAEAEHKENFMENEEKVVETEEVEKEVKQPEEKEVEKTETPVVETEKEEQVVETEEVGNGISIDQVVTKDILAEALNGITAKLDALINENKSLKNELANKDSEINDMKNKYETNDFGNTAKKGVDAKDKKYASFDEYSKQFM